MKNGIKTSEFWMSIVGAGLLIANKGLNLGIDEGTVTAFAAMIVSYVLSRSAVKASVK